MLGRYHEASSYLDLGLFLGGWAKRIYGEPIVVVKGLGDGPFRKVFEPLLSEG